MEGLSNPLRALHQRRLARLAMKIPDADLRVSYRSNGLRPLWERTDDVIVLPSAEGLFSPPLLEDEGPIDPVERFIAAYRQVCAAGPNDAPPPENDDAEGIAAAEPSMDGRTAGEELLDDVRDLGWS